MARTGKDLTGQRFGRLAVTGFGGYGHNTRQRVALWNCHCDCGENCLVEGYLLVNGRRKSCGCIRRSAEKMTGERFGKLVVLGVDPDNQTTLQKVRCQCDCGTIKSIATRDLKNGRVTSCGCDRMGMIREQDVWERQYDEQKEALRSAFQKGNFQQIGTLEEWVYIWLREVLGGVVKKTTVRMYAEAMEHHILPSMGRMQLEEITEAAVSDWLERLRDTKMTGTKRGCMTEGTLRNTLSVLSGCMRDAQKYGLIEKNPCLQAAWALKETNVGEENAWLTKEQVQALDPSLIAYKDEDGRPLGIGLRLVLYTGMTLSEAAALQWKDIHTKEKQIDIHRFVAARRQEFGNERRYELESLTGRKKRSVPIPDFFCKDLVQLEQEFGQDPELFVVGGGKEPARIDRLRAALQRRASKCGLEEVTPRMLRDTYAMRAVQAGATSDLITRWMGFASSQQVIRRYMPEKTGEAEMILARMFADRT